MKRETTHPPLTRDPPGPSPGLEMDMKPTTYPTLEAISAARETLLTAARLVPLPEMNQRSLTALVLEATDCLSAHAEYPEPDPTPPTKGPTPAQRQTAITELADLVTATVAAIDSGRWTAAEVIAVLERGPARREPGPPSPEEILEAGERLAGMVEAVPPKTEAAMRQARMVRDIARQSAYTLRVTAASSRSPG